MVRYWNDALDEAVGTKAAHGCRIRKGSLKKNVVLRHPTDADCHPQSISLHFQGYLCNESG